MKRIMLLAMVMLMLAPGISFGYSCVYRGYRGYRWSTMLGEYIDSDCRWSTMLGQYIPRGYRWSTILGEYIPRHYTSCSLNVVYTTNRKSYCVAVQQIQSFEQIKRIYKARKKHHKESNGESIILNYLKSKKINFKIRNGLFIQSETLCREFLLENGNLIKYRNPRAIEQAKKNPRHNESYEAYKEDWIKFREKHTGEIYEIRSADKKEILAGLESCPGLSVKN